MGYHGAVDKMLRVTLSEGVSLEVVTQTLYLDAAIVQQAHESENASQQPQQRAVRMIHAP
jgi:hypothetical protein